MSDYLQHVLLRLCKQPRSFEFISKNLDGLDPVEAHQALSKLEECNLLVCIEDMWCIKEVSWHPTLALYPAEPELNIQKHMGYFDFLKTPHPLDYEWRNSSSSLNRLIQRIVSVVNPNDKLLFLGMPTLFATAIEKDIANPTRLIERNTPILEGLKRKITDSKRFQTLEADIFTIDPAIVKKHYCVVMDPPWYTPHFFQFMWLAAQTVELGGIVAISLPPINTRPNIAEERNQWFSYCKDLGLCIESLEPQKLQYTMPFFEFNAFRAAGIKNILPFWRKGDLAIFRKTSNTGTKRPEHTPLQTKWIEKEYNGTRLRIDKSHEDLSSDAGVQIEAIIKGDILPTVSSRDERRKGVNLWTSGNRIYKVNRPSELQRIIIKIASGAELTASDQMIKDFLDMLSSLEKQEYKEYLDWIYYEMERQID